MSDHSSVLKCLLPYLVYHFTSLGCAHSGSSTASVSIVSEGLRKAHEREKNSSLSGSIVESIYAGHAYLGKQVLIAG